MTCAVLASNAITASYTKTVKYLKECTTKAQSSRKIVHKRNFRIYAKTNCIKTEISIAHMAFAFCQWLYEILLRVGKIVLKVCRFIVKHENIALITVT